jgi:dipeptidyl aminopeptidase/acylaminoacyl peptidase
MEAMEGPPIQLTKGNFMLEHIHMAGDGSTLFFSANHGPLETDIDRRHIGRVPVSGGSMEMLTQGKGIETFPVLLSDAKRLGYLAADDSRPLMPTVMDLERKTSEVLASERLPTDFPLANLVAPKQVVFKASDGLTIHGQLFEKAGGPAKKPAVVFVHGGPQRQMLLGWHYGDYYSNTYAINQYLADLGFVVLSVNFRLGIGYGYEFHKAPKTYVQGAEEYLDIKAAGEYLAGLPQVDSSRIGIYGGSYGGYLTALALGKDPDLFKVGVDIHGVHNLSSRLEMPDGYEKAPDFEEAVRTAWFSSPLAYLDRWKSPVLLIHGDDDRNVPVSQTTDLVRRLEEKGLPFDFLMIPGDSHHWMKYANLVQVDQAVADFLLMHLRPH